MKIKFTGKSSLWADKSPNLPQRFLEKDKVYDDLSEYIVNEVLKAKCGDKLDCKDIDTKAKTETSIDNKAITSDKLNNKNNKKK